QLLTAATVQTMGIPVVPQTDGPHFRIAVSESYLYACTDHSVWRKRHDAALAGDAAWETITLPESSKLLLDFAPFSDDGIVAVVDKKLWQGALTTPEALPAKTQAAWTACAKGSGVRLVKRPHESAESFAHVLEIARSHVDGHGFLR